MSDDFKQETRAVASQLLRRNVVFHMHPIPRSAWNFGKIHLEQISDFLLPVTKTL